MSTRKPKQIAPCPMKFYNGDWSPDDLQFPLIALNKIDGIFVWKWRGKALSKDNKLITNDSIRIGVERNFPDGINGEIFITGGNFQDVASFVATKTAVDSNARIALFDIAVPHTPYSTRLSHACKIQANIIPDKIIIPSYRICENYNDVEKFYNFFLSNVSNFEGLVLRSCAGHYKFGRATLSEATAFKLCAMKTDEVTWHGTVPSSNVGLNQAGAIIAMHPTYGRMTIGSGFDQELAVKMHHFPQDYRGKKFRMKYKNSGIKDMPRQPVFDGFV